MKARLDVRYMRLLIGAFYYLFINIVLPSVAIDYYLNDIGLDSNDVSDLKTTT